MLHASTQPQLAKARVQRPGIALQQVMLCFRNPAVTSSGHGRMSLRSLARLAATSSTTWETQPQDDNGMVDSMLNACLSTTARITDAVVSRLVDALQSVAPPQAPRSKVEAAVKGALILLLLGLLKGVISFVLLVGCAGLAVFTATQVFGWRALSLGQGGGDVNWTEQQSWQHPPSTATLPPRGHRSHKQAARPSSHSRAWPQQQQQWQGQQPGWQWPPQGPGQQQQLGVNQGDVVDVFPYPRPPPAQ